MKEKVTLIIALSFVLGLTIYKHSQDGVESSDNLAEQKSEVNEQQIVDVKIQEEAVQEETVVKYSNSEKSRAQLYIDKDWAPDETINEIVYKDLGGPYTKYWNNLNVTDKTQDKPDTKSVKPIKEKVDLVQN